MVSVAESGHTLLVCDPSLESYALEQPEMPRSHDYKVMQNFSWRPLYNQYFHSKATYHMAMVVFQVFSFLFFSTSKLSLRYSCIVILVKKATKIK